MEGARNSLFRNPRFVKLWMGQGISFVGDAISMVALVILVARISGSATAVGGVLLAQLLPTLASPLAGVLADRLDRRFILVAADLARAVLLVGMVFSRDLSTLYVLAFLTGVARTFFNPTVRAAFPAVVGDADLTRANAIIGGTFSLSVAVGPALGGLLVATVGVNAAFLLDASTFLISAILLFQVPLPRPQREEDDSGFTQDLRAGLSYIARSRIPLGIVVGAFLTVLAMNITVPAEVFLAKETFDAGSTGYGLLVSLWGAGMVLGSALMIALGERVRLLPLYFLSLLGSALAFVFTGLSPTFVLALAALTVAGLCNGIDNIATDTILQTSVPDSFLGRVFAVRMLAFYTGEALAYLAGGFAVDAIGPRSMYLLGGTATVIAGLLVLLLILIAPQRGGK